MRAPRWYRKRRARARKRRGDAISAAINARHEATMRRMREPGGRLYRRKPMIPMSASIRRSLDSAAASLAPDAGVATAAPTTRSAPPGTSDHAGVAGWTMGSTLHSAGGGE